MEAIQEAQANLLKVFAERMDTFESELGKSSLPSTSISSLASEFVNFKSFVFKSLKTLQEQIELIQIATDQIEMRTRRKILLLHGIPEQKQEDSNALVTKILKDKLKFTDFNSMSIRRSHRMGKALSSISTRPRPILIKFCDTVLRNKVWFAKTQLKGTGITLSEFMTRKRHSLFVMARQRFGVTGTWTRDGNIFVIDSDGKRHRITRLSDMENVPASRSEQQVNTKPSTKEPSAPNKSRRATSAARK